LQNWFLTWIYGRSSIILKLCALVDRHLATAEAKAGRVYHAQFCLLT
jgi:hypothetical protein